MFSESFYTVLIGSISGLILAIAALIYKSKCSDVICGQLQIHRDVEGEEKLDALTIST